MEHPFHTGHAGNRRHSAACPYPSQRRTYAAVSEKKSYEVVLDNGTTFQWNAEYDDPSMLRNALSFHYFNTIGVEAPKTRHCKVEWNGQPLGMYLEIESFDRIFFESRGLDCRSIHYAVHDSANFRSTDPITRKRKKSWYEGYELKLGKKSGPQPPDSFYKKAASNQGTGNEKPSAGAAGYAAVFKMAGRSVLTGNYDGFDQIMLCMK